MEYKRDLLKENKKSKIRLIIGIAFFVISIFWIITKLLDSDLIKPFDWFYSGIFALNGVAHVLGGLGHSIERVFGKAFVLIDNKMIIIKLGVFEKEQKVDWRDIQSIDYKPNNFKIQKIDNSTKLISISKLNYSCISDIKEIISKLAESKEIKYSIQ